MASVVAPAGVRVTATIMQAQQQTRKAAQAKEVLYIRMLFAETRN